MNCVQNVIKLSSMKDLMKWLYVILCVFAFVVLFGMAKSPHVTKDQFVDALFGLYMILIVVALFKKD